MSTDTDIQTEKAVCATACVYGWSEETGVHALAEAENELAAEGAKAQEACVSIWIPWSYEKSRLFDMQKRLEKMCRARGLRIGYIKQGKTTAANLPFVVVTCTGGRRCAGERESVERRGSGASHDTHQRQAGQDIVLTKWAGMSGMLRVAEEKEAELGQRFAPAFINQIQAFRQEIFAGKEIDIARKIGVRRIHQIAGGGILAALWELAKETQTGLEIDMKQISVRQETIEVCENYRLNPYQLISTGSFLMISDDGVTLAEELNENGVQAAVIGHTTEDNDKIIHNGEDVRYIDRPAPDELNKIFI